jgi:N-acetylneuraminic acid mutarotase
MSDFPGGGRFEVASFSIGNKIYMGLGYDSQGLTVRDFWEWDGNSDQWTRMADLPVYSVRGSTTFTMDGKGYVLAVVHRDEDLLVNELWEFDPAENKWTRMADLPENPARHYATGFSIGDKAYIGLGMKGFSYDLNQFYSDLWEWDRTTNTWTRKADFPGGARAGAAGFSIGTKGYVGTGDGNRDYFRDGLTGDPLWYMPPTGYDGLYADFWEYDQASDTWTRKADYMGAARKGALGFSVGNKGYIGMGQDPLAGAVGLARDIWVWDQASDSWTKIGDFAGIARTAYTGGSIGNMGYLAGGFTWSDWETGFYSIQVMSDLWIIDLNGTKP